jgi:type I restriction-modification system DNA methylase subunit
MSHQLSLFDRSLFRKEMLTRWLHEHELDTIPNKMEIFIWISNWNKAVKGDKKQKETVLEQSFNSELFCKYLGYVMIPGREGRFTAWPKPSVKDTGLSNEPDLILGHFAESNFEPKVVVELKKPGISLDAIQPQHDNKTPVEQAFEYAENLSSCKWVIVSDMLQIRLYSAENPTRFHSFNLRSCITAKPGELTEEFLHLYALLRADALIDGGDDSKVARLYRNSKSIQQSFQEGFYEIYSQIRRDLINEIQTWNENSNNKFYRPEVVAAAQRLLDRLMFIYYCEDHPDRLLPKGLVKEVCDNALRLPGNSTTKVYNTLRQLFRDIDLGADTPYWKIPRYNGELFKEHSILEKLDLPDSLATKLYKTEKAKSKPVKGIWGLHVFDFWTELDKDLLGNIFERSLSDLAILTANTRNLTIAESVKDQKTWGIFYTSGNLARFMAESVVSAAIKQSPQVNDIFKRVANSKNSIELLKSVSDLLESMKSLKIIDLACGSGIFLTGALESLIRIYRSGLEQGKDQLRELESYLAISRQSELLRSIIFGVDLFPQAAELTKLALWLTTAKKDEITSDLSNNIFSGDSFNPTIKTMLQDVSNGGFDIVLGNPPWGGQYKINYATELIHNAGFNHNENWDSWEIFILLATSLLKQGGRLSIVVPDTIHSVEKRRIREFIINHYELEYFYNLGPDWFSSTIRMGTVIFQGVKKQREKEARYKGMVLSGLYRKDALSGELSLRQIEAQIGSRILQERSAQHPDFEIRPFCSETDYKILDRLVDESESLSVICERARGEEMNADGLFWRCPNCFGYTVPGKKQKGGTYDSKLCPFCSLKISDETVHKLSVVSDIKNDDSAEPYISGEELTNRYQNLKIKWITTNLNPVLPAFKQRHLYRPPKILIRQAGVGITATISYGWDRCPQSVYVYRCSNEARSRGYSEEYILAAIVSRTMNYYLFKRFGEVDPARAHVKVTHKRLEQFPIPRIDTDEKKEKVKEIERLVQKMLQRQKHGSDVDHRIEHLLREIWGVSPREGAYINGVFNLIPVSQVVKDLFPDGIPKAFVLESE